MEAKLRSLGIRQVGDIRCLIEQNNNLPYKERDRKLSALYDVIVEYNTSAIGKSRVKKSEDAYSCLCPKMRDLNHEEMWCIFLNKVQDVLKIKRMFVGGLDSTSVDVRLIIKEAIMLNATGVIIAHNHPSGEVKPSNVDKALTKKLKDGASMCDITLLDHLVIARDKYYSFSDEGNL